MKQALSEAERIRLDRSIAEAEQRCGAQIVLAVIGRSDSYAEIPWLAFALGVSLAGLAVFGLSGRDNALLIAITTILAAGGASALLAMYLPGFARLFLAAHRAEAEMRQYAQALFLERELFATRKRRTVLLVVSLFEQQAMLVIDKGLRDCLTADSEQAVTARIKQAFASGPLVTALEAGLEQLVSSLEAATSACSSLEEPDQLPNQVIEERGV